MADGVTALVPLTATFPIPLSRLTLLAPVTVQLSVELPPDSMLAGLALNEVITGGFLAAVQPGKYTQTQTSIVTAISADNSVLMLPCPPLTIRVMSVYLPILKGFQTSISIHKAGKLFQ